MPGDKNEENIIITLFINLLIILQNKSMILRGGGMLLIRGKEDFKKSIFVENILFSFNCKLCEYKYILDFLGNPICGKRFIFEK